jgi:uncharacterized membrane protein YoaK (UPF0700 family)
MISTAQTVTSESGCQPKDENSDSISVEEEGEILCQFKEMARRVNIATHVIEDEETQSSSETIQNIDHHLDNPIVFTKAEKTILLALKAAFAFSWGFINAIIYLVSGRFATMMTGNLLLLAMSTKEWAVEDMSVTAVLIIAYILGGAVYDVLFIKFNDKGILRYLIPSIIIMGVLTDVLQYSIDSCSDMERDITSQCRFEGKSLYSLTPISIMTGMIATSCTHHADGDNTTLMTGHMRIFPHACVNIMLAKNDDLESNINRDLLKEKARTSFALVSSCFLGVLTGAFSEATVVSVITERNFSPVFSIFGCWMATLCLLRHTLCERFFIHHRSLNAEINKRMSLAYFTKGKEEKSFRSIVDLEERENERSTTAVNVRI